MESYLIDVLLVACLIRFLVGYWGYSGFGTPPMFGDYEAQRHWMEITTGLPIGEWYRKSSLNDLSYWGLDYPPLTAYVSWFFGVIAHYVYPNLVRLTLSRGHESSTGKLFMRLSVIVCDLLVYLPSIILLIPAMNFTKKSNKSTSYALNSFLKCLVLSSVPALLLIDHGHFQYNGVCIGLTLLAAICIAKDMDLLGSVFFCLSLNFKQMALYYAPVFFFALLYKCNQKPTIPAKLIHLVKIGATVILTFLLLWMPFCVFRDSSETCVSSWLLIVQRVFPFARGIFEDKVANLWYAFSVLFDYREYLSSPQQMVPYSLGLTLILLSPVAVNLLRNRSDATQLCIALSNSALAFFLASFQVHEKSLLLSLVPATAVLLQLDPVICVWYQVLGSFTMFPLLVRDGLRIPYFAVNILFATLVALYVMVNAKKSSIASTSGTEKVKGKQIGGLMEILLKYRYLFVVASGAGMIILHLLEATVTPPRRYPDLYPALFSLFGAANLLVVYIAGVLLQYYYRVDNTVSDEIFDSEKTQNNSSSDVAQSSSDILGSKSPSRSASKPKRRSSTPTVKQPSLSPSHTPSRTREKRPSSRSSKGIQQKNNDNTNIISDPTPTGTRPRRRSSIKK